MRVKKIIQLNKFYYLFFLLCLLVTFNSLRYYFRLDFSRTKVFSISPYTEKTLAAVPDRLHITYYLSEKLKTFYPQTRDISDFLLSYAGINRFITFSVVDPQKASLEKMLESIGVLPRQIQSSEQNQTSFITVYSAIVLEYGGKTAQIPFILSTAGLEYDLNIRVDYLVKNITREVALLAGEGKTFDENYKYVVPWLEAAGFTSLHVTPGDLPFLDTKTPLLVIGSRDLSADDVFEIESFVLNGGATAFAVSHNTVNITGDWTAEPVKNDKLLDLLDFWGFEIGKSLVLDSVNYRITMKGAEDSGRYEYIDYPFWIRLLPQYADRANPLSAGFYGMETYWASPIFLSPDKDHRPLFKTSPAAWLLEPSKDEPAFITDPFTAQKPNAATRGQYTVAAVSNGPFLPYYGTGAAAKERLAVIGNQYFCSNLIEYTNSPQNIDFLANLLLWLSGDDSMLALRAKGGVPAVLTKLSGAAEFARAKTLTACALAAVPVFAAALYALFMLKRRKQK